MIVKLNTSGERYYNIIELVCMLVHAETLAALGCVRLYDIENGSWNLRRLFWYIAIGVPALAWFVVTFIASLRML